MDTDWTLVFMDENNRIFHREPLLPGTPLPQSPTWDLVNGTRQEVKQYIYIPGWKHGGNPATVYHTIISYDMKEFTVAVHGIYEG